MDLKLGYFLFVVFCKEIQGDQLTLTSQETYKAAVFDKAPVDIYLHTKVLTRDEALAMIEPSLDLYHQQTAVAAFEGADIIVFPEYGLYPLGTTRDQQEPFTESIPDPSTGWNPCLDPDRFPDTEIQRNLSCMAYNNDIYVVANMGDHIPCEGGEGCVGGRYQYNTNVAYNRSGALVARYHKYNLFFEERYDIPPNPEYGYFDTPFGRLGFVVCFDLLFEEPTIKLIEDYNIDTLVFPTAWMNVLPYFSAVPFHQAFGIGNNINVLGANLHMPIGRFSGSGVYQYNGTVAFRNDETSSEAGLLVGNVAAKPVKTPRQDVTVTSTDQVDFTAEIFGDVYNFVAITEMSGTARVCSDILCCEVQYERMTQNNEFFALGAFRGLHTLEGVYYIEICAFLKCSEGTENHCEDGTITTSETHFSFVNLTGGHNTKYVFPMFVSTDVDPAQGMWSYDGRSILSQNTAKSLLSAISFGRLYDLDDPSMTPQPPGGNPGYCKSPIMLLICANVIIAWFIKSL